MLFEKRRQAPIEERSYATHYLVLSALLFLGTAWAVLDEVLIRRPWKEFQSDFYDLQVEKLQAAHEAALSRVDSSRLQELQSRLAEARELLKRPEYDQAQKQLEDLQVQLLDVTREWQFARSRFDALYYAFKTELNEGYEDPGKKERLSKLEQEIAEYKGRMDEFNERIAEVMKVIDSSKGQVDGLKVE
ncbi:MAG: hypothetical protein ACE5H0_05900, partial [Bacteroidota bacterium]